MLPALSSHYKQGSIGDATGARPAMMNVLGQGKFAIWTARKGLVREEAMGGQVKLVASLKAARESRTAWRWQIIATRSIACVAMLFASCAPLQLARVLGKLEAVTFAAGQELYARGSKADALYLLDDGDVELITESGRRMELQAPRCGEEAATDLKTYLATATARTPVQALRLPREALTELGMASRRCSG